MLGAAAVGLWSASAAASAPLHLKRTVGRIVFDAPAGAMCDFALHIEQSGTLNLTRFFDEQGNLIWVEAQADMSYLIRKVETGSVAASTGASPRTLAESLSPTARRSHDGDVANPHRAAATGHDGPRQSSGPRRRRRRSSSATHPRLFGHVDVVVGSHEHRRSGHRADAIGLLAGACKIGSRLAHRPVAQLARTRDAGRRPTLRPARYFRCAVAEESGDRPGEVLRLVHGETVIPTWSKRRICDMRYILQISWCRGPRQSRPSPWCGATSAGRSG
jgi:hypothetical protein